MAGVSGRARLSAWPGRRWDVALAFAGAQRDYVSQVAAALKAQGVRCFYDADEQVRLWETHLTEELPRIYTHETAAVVVFLSADYAGGDWTRMERRAEFSRAVAEAGAHLLPARFDDSELPGLLPDVKVVDLRRYTPSQFADLITAKLADLAVVAPTSPVHSPSADVGANTYARPRRQWDVALSFAGAQRDYVGQVATALRAQGVRCFYDADEDVSLWGTHLAEELPRIYAQETAAIVMFASADYSQGA